MKVRGVDANQPAPELNSGPRAAQEFEAYLIGFLSKQMREAVPDGPLNSGASGMFADLMDQEIGKRAAEGQGIGLRHQLEVALARHVPSPSEDPAPRILPSPHPSPLPHVPGVSSGFGVRTDPIDGTRRMHHGVDLRRPLGTGVKAERSGVVTFAGERGGYGNLVIVDHGGGFETRYAHCATLSVHQGEAVRQGELIGTSGNTGRSTGPHLHFEARQDGVPIDPLQFVHENE